MPKNTSGTINSSLNNISKQQLTQKEIEREWKKNQKLFDEEKALRKEVYFLESLPMAKETLLQLGTYKRTKKKLEEKREEIKIKFPMKCTEQELITELSQ